jgi:hypothetical protein
MKPQGYEKWWQIHSKCVLNFDQKLDDQCLLTNR